MFWRRFTQEDPIGLAGGANLYGFAGGDRVNFSDPFGLKPPIGAAVVRIIMFLSTLLDNDARVDEFMKQHDAVKQMVHGVAQVEESLEGATGRVIKETAKNAKPLGKKAVWNGAKRAAEGAIEAGAASEGSSVVGGFIGGLLGAVGGIAVTPTKAGSVCASTPSCGKQPDKQH